MSMHTSGESAVVQCKNERFNWFSDKEIAGLKKKMKNITMKFVKSRIYKRIFLRGGLKIRMRSWGTCIASARRLLLVCY